MADNTLTTVDFHGAKLIARRGDSPAETLVAMKPVVEGMGLTWEPQHRKLASHPVLSQGITIMMIPSAGGPQEMTALPLNRLNFWLATIQPDRVPDEGVRAKVIEYQTECADVLFNHFFGRAIHALDDVSQVLSPKQCADTRRLLGLTLTQFEAGTGFFASAISEFERGRRVLPAGTQAELRKFLEQEAARLRKAARTQPTPSGREAVPSTVRLQFTVPVQASAKICAYVAKVVTAGAAPKAVAGKGR